MTRIEERSDSLKSALEESSHQLEEKSTELKQSRCDVENFKMELDHLSRENSTCLQQLCDVTSSLDESRAKCNQQKQNMDALEEQVAKLSSVNSSLSKEAKSSQDEILRLQRELDSAQRLIQIKLSELNELTVAAARHEEIAAQLSRTQCDLQSQMEMANAEKFHAIKELTQLRDQMNQMSMTNNGDKSQLQKLRTELTTKDSRITEANKKILSLQSAVDELGELRSAKDDLQQKYNALLLEQDLLLGHSNKKQKIQYIQSLKCQIQQLVDENAKLRTARQN